MFIFTSNPVSFLCSHFSWLQFARFLDQKKGFLFIFAQDVITVEFPPYYCSHREQQR